MIGDGCPCQRPAGKSFRDPNADYGVAHVKFSLRVFSSTQQLHIDANLVQISFACSQHDKA
jgi:hypothetical protein